MINRRCFLAWACLLPAAALAGCSGDPDAGRIKVEENQEEQKLLHDQIRKGLANPPPKKRR
ncbi:hypothetical protein [Aquisphaera insulae]|uniref:hypothetical protein n=1 Tax=Aquisphaera insulae TaxID=2712864 RepID=UPI0013EA3425|nr:hypothetical protein [Aquisphaera insulae]